MSDSFSPQPTIEKPEPELPRFDEDKRGTLRALVEAFVYCGPVIPDICCGRLHDLDGIHGTVTVGLS